MKRISVYLLIYILFSLPLWTGDEVPGGQLKQVLVKAANYCEKLKAEAFHYFCIEEIDEVYNKYPTYRRWQDKGKRHKAHREEHRYVYEYQILKKDGTVQEKRVLVEKDGKKMRREKANLYTRFVYSYRSFYGPISLAGKKRQRYYRYNLVERIKRAGGDIFVVEAIPQKKSAKKQNYGKLWIHSLTGSVLRIEVDDKSIRGYEGMKTFARKYGATPSLKVTHYYDMLHRGLRYPSKTEFIESYSGGANLRRKFKDGRYIRSNTTFVYKNYHFFDVQVEYRLDKQAPPKSQ
jgi:hypothetical protein